MTAYSGRGRRSARYCVATVVSVLAIATTAAWSHAAVTITPAPDFQVAITAGEAVSVGCSGGNVVVTIDAVLFALCAFVTMFFVVRLKSASRTCCAVELGLPCGIPRSTGGRSIIKSLA